MLSWVIYYQQWLMLEEKFLVKSYDCPMGAVRGGSRQNLHFELRLGNINSINIWQSKFKIWDTHSLALYFNGSLLHHTVVSFEYLSISMSGSYCINKNGANVYKLSLPQHPFSLYMLSQMAATLLVAVLICHRLALNVTNGNMDHLLHQAWPMSCLEIICFLDIISCPVKW